MKNLKSILSEISYRNNLGRGNRRYSRGFEDSSKGPMGFTGLPEDYSAVVVVETKDGKVKESQTKKMDVYSIQNFLKNLIDNVNTPEKAEKVYSETARSARYGSKVYEDLDSYFKDAARRPSLGPYHLNHFFVLFKDKKWHYIRQQKTYWKGIKSFEPLKTSEVFVKTSK